MAKTERDSYYRHIEPEDVALGEPEWWELPAAIVLGAWTVGIWVAIVLAVAWLIR